MRRKTQGMFMPEKKLLLSMKICKSKCRLVIFFTVFLLLVFFIKSGNKLLPQAISPFPQPAKNTIFPSTSIAIPADARVLEPADAAPDSETAVPASVYPEGRDAYGKRRLFEIKAAGNRFSPSKIVVNQDDIVTIKFISADKTYDFALPSFGIKQTISPDNLRFAEFQANIEGAFPIYCPLCDGEKVTGKGIIVVISRGQNQSSSINIGTST